MSLLVFVLLFAASEVSGEAAKISVKLSERAASERMKKRGLHHPLMTEHIVLKVNTIQKARCSDEAGINMECNARLRDAWGSPPPQDPSPSPHLDVHPNLRSSQALKRSSQAQKHLPCHRIVTSTTKTYTPILNRSFDKNMRNNLNSRDITSAVSDVTIRLTHPSVCLKEPHQCLVSERTLSRRSGTQEPFRKVGAFTTSAKEGPRAPERMLMRAIPNSAECCMKLETSRTPVPLTKPVDPLRDRSEFRLLTETQLREYIRAQRESTKTSLQKNSNKN